MTSMNSESISGRVGSFAPAQKELTDIEIRRDYGALLDGAVSAFGSDPSYLVDMAEHASLIAYKRALWEVRMEVQRQEQYARQRCTLDNKICPFACSNEGACGFGSCRYAGDDHVAFNISSQGGDKGRPEEMAANSSRYRLDDTIAAVLKDRGVVPPARLSKGSRRKPREN